KLKKEPLGKPKDHNLKFVSSLHKKGKDELVDYLFDDLVEEV
ncbi:ribosome biogenesis GTP-binding protein YihA/YsxC, partial [Clostridium perfringens]